LVQADSRHQFQQKTVEWIGEMLAAETRSLTETAGEAGVVVEQFKTEKTQCEHCVGELQGRLTQLSETAVDAELLSSDASAAVQAAEQAAKDVGVLWAAKEGEVATMTSAKNEIVAMMAEDGEFAKMKGVKNSKKAAGALVSKFKKVGLDPSSFVSLSATLTTDPNGRSSFDSMVLAFVEEALTSQVKQLESAITSATPKPEDKVLAVAKAEEAATAARSEAEKAKSRLSVAQDAVKQCEMELMNLRSRQQDLESKLKQAECTLQEATASVEAFSNGPCAEFEHLNNFKPETPSEEFGEVNAVPLPEGSIEGPSMRQQVSI